MDHTVSFTALPEKLRLPVIASLMFSEPVSSLSRGKKVGLKPATSHRGKFRQMASRSLAFQVRGWKVK